MGRLEHNSKINFLEFLSEEEHNLLASMCNMREEFDLFFNLDQIYKEPLVRLKPPLDDIVIPQLYFFAHYHLFISVASLLRVHLAEALSSTRKAIDGALTAYELIEHPEKTADYLNGDRHFANIKSALKKCLAENEESYPLANGLINYHELFSKFGSHADFSGFAHRLKVDRNENGDTTVQFNYFHKPEKAIEFRYYFLCVLYSYYQMFLIFRKYFDNQFKIIDSGWESRIEELGKVLPRKIKALKEQI